MKNFLSLLLILTTLLVFTGVASADGGNYFTTAMSDASGTTALKSASYQLGIINNVRYSGAFGQGNVAHGYNWTFATSSVGIYWGAYSDIYDSSGDSRVTWFISEGYTSNPPTCWQGTPFFYSGGIAYGCVGGDDDFGDGQGEPWIAHLDYEGSNTWKMFLNDTDQDQLPLASINGQPYGISSPSIVSSETWFGTTDPLSPMAAVITTERWFNAVSAQYQGWSYGSLSYSQVPTGGYSHCPDSWAVFQPFALHDIGKRMWTVTSFGRINSTSGYQCNNVGFFP